MRTLFTTAAAGIAVATLLVTGGAPSAFAAQDLAETRAGDSSTAMKASNALSMLSLSASATAGLAPMQVTLVATVSGTALTGNIAFKSGTLLIAIAAINKSTATVTISLPAAIHSLTAVYTAVAGDIVSPPTIVVIDNQTLACS